MICIIWLKAIANIQKKLKTYLRYILITLLGKFIFSFFNIFLLTLSLRKGFNADSDSYSLEFIFG